MGATSRRKGSRGELMVRDIYRSIGFDCRRNFGSGSQGMGDLIGNDMPDVPEVKNAERIMFWAWVQQAAENVRPPYGVDDWSLWVTGNRRPLVVVCSSNRYIRLLEDQRTLQRSSFAEGIR